MVLAVAVSPHTPGLNRIPSLLFLRSEQSHEFLLLAEEREGSHLLTVSLLASANVSILARGDGASLGGQGSTEI